VGSEPWAEARVSPDAGRTQTATELTDCVGNACPPGRAKRRTRHPLLHDSDVAKAIAAPAARALRKESSANCTSKQPEDVEVGPASESDGSAIAHDRLDHGSTLARPEPCQYGYGVVVREREEAATGLDDDPVVQTYETTLYADGVPPARFVTIPASVLLDEARGDLPRLLDAFGWQQVRDFGPAELPGVLWQCLSPQRDWPAGERDLWTIEDRALVGFIERIIFLPSIPFESSDQESKSLGALMAAGATTGAGVGTAVAVGPHAPIMIVTVPAGFVIGGLVGAVTHALGRSVDAGISGLFKRKPGTDVSAE